MEKEHWVKILLRFAAPCQGKLLLSIFFALVSVAGGMVPYYGVYRMIALFIENQVTVTGLVYWSGICLAGYVVKILGYGISTVLSHVSAYTILAGLRQKIADRLMQASLGASSAYSIGRIKGIVVDQVENIEPPLAHMIPELSANLVLPLVVFGTLLKVNVWLALASLVTVPLAMIPLRFGMRTYHEKYADYMAANAQVNSVIVEYVEGIEVIKAFGQSGTSYEKFQKAIFNFKEFTLDWFKSTWVSMNLVMAILPTTLLGTLPVGLWLYSRGELTPAQLAFCLMLALGMISSLLKATQFINEAKVMEFAVNDANLLLTLPELPEVQKLAELKSYDIALEDVAFSYTASPQDNVLKQVNFTIPAGNFAALVGPSGGGKSTVAKLITRFWDVSAGRITIGGVDIREIPLKQLASVISFVTQDNFLFDCSLKENIRLGNPAATDAEVLRAAEAAQCGEFIQRLEQGLETSAGDAGKQLSGGERQRIAIARAILKDAPIVILDEATAFTDPENEAKIQKSIMELTKGKTLLVIAHRLSTIQKADKIIVLENGKVVATGTQSELLETCPLYQKLWFAHIGAKNWSVHHEEVVGNV